MGKVRNAYNTLVGKPERKRPLGDLDVDGKMTLEWILWKSGLKVWIGCIWLRIGTSGRLL
jgi:hypothetical protein